jgi:hypothetical protein
MIFLDELALDPLLLAHLRQVYLERSVDMATPKIRSANAVRVNLIERHLVEMS